MRIEPLHDQLVVRPIEDGHYSKEGLLIPQVARDNAPYRYGDVIGVGTGRTNNEGKNVPCVCKEGDVVAYAKGAGVEFPLKDAEGKEEVVLLLSEKYVLGRVHELERATSIVSLDGSLMKMVPQSRTQSGFNQGAAPDVAYKNQDEADRAQRAGWDMSDHTDEVH